MNIVLIIIILFAIFDFYTFQKEHVKKRVYFIYSIFTSFSIIICILLNFGYRPASPAQLIESLLKSSGVIKNAG